MKKCVTGEQLRQSLQLSDIVVVAPPMRIRKVTEINGVRVEVLIHDRLFDRLGVSPA